MDMHVLILSARRTKPYRRDFKILDDKKLVTPLGGRVKGVGTVGVSGAPEEIHVYCDPNKLEVSLRLECLGNIPDHRRGEPQRALPQHRHRHRVIHASCRVANSGSVRAAGHCGQHEERPDWLSQGYRPQSSTVLRKISGSLSPTVREPL